MYECSSHAMKFRQESITQGVVMKKLAVLAWALCAFSAHAKELATFDQVAKAVLQGEKITFVIDFKNCSSKMPLLGTTVSMAPNTVMVLGNNRITASGMNFTLDGPIARDTPVYEFTKFTINKRGDATMRMTVMNATNYEEMASYRTDCELGEGFKVFG